MWLAPLSPPLFARIEEEKSLTIGANVRAIEPWIQVWSKLQHYIHIYDEREATVIPENRAKYHVICYARKREDRFFTHVGSFHRAFTNQRHDFQSNNEALRSTALIALNLALTKTDSVNVQSVEPICLQGKLTHNLQFPHTLYLKKKTLTDIILLWIDKHYVLRGPNTDGVTQTEPIVPRERERSVRSTCEQAARLNEYESTRRHASRVHPSVPS